MKKHIQLFLLFLTTIGGKALAQSDTTTYHIAINRGSIEIAGKQTTTMTINGTVPGPTLRFREGDYAQIFVENKMDVETSIHWHGILLPNFFDGVPYLTTPPVEPGKTFKYEFRIKQAGTYWYHSHTGLQEQRGVYGSIVIEAQEERMEYDRDLVVVLGDWTYENPRDVLRTLKRGLEWYNIKKGTATPLNKIISRGALGAQLNFWKQRMEGMDISDIYYPVFISNGQPVREYPEFQSGEKIRLRFINAAASSEFWLTFGGDPALLIAADGLDVEPVRQEKTFIAVAETYDFIVEIPENGKLEARATAQDGTGHTSIFLGAGPTLYAPEDLPVPDLIRMMKEMAAMDMKMGAFATKFNPKKEKPYRMAEKYGMDMEKDEHADMADHSRQMGDQSGKHDGHSEAETNKDEETKHSGKRQDMEQKLTDDEISRQRMPMEGMDATHEMPDMAMFSEFNYDHLKSPERTALKDQPLREILLNLTGNMQRYLWSMNGVPLSEGDKIRIKQGEIVRVTLNNLTMMHHPMHLHGHFFRVINRYGEYSPLKHTVNVAPMQKITIEFDANEYGDWFFHCHILYHMDAGMARVFSYGTPRDERLKEYPMKILTNVSNHFFTWGDIAGASHMAELNVVSTNIRNQFILSTEYGWNENLEAELTYGRYLNDFLSIFAGVNGENEIENTLDEVEVNIIGGIRYLTPYLFELDVRVDNKLRPQVEVGRELLIFRRLELFGEFECQADFGWSGEKPIEGESAGGGTYTYEITWNAGLEYIISKSFSLTGAYDNRFGAGGGLLLRF